MMGRAMIRELSLMMVNPLEPHRHEKDRRSEIRDNSCGEELCPSISPSHGVTRCGSEMETRSWPLRGHDLTVLSPSLGLHLTCLLLAPMGGPQCILQSNEKGRPWKRRHWGRPKRRLLSSARPIVLFYHVMWGRDTSESSLSWEFISWQTLIVDRPFKGSKNML